MKLKDTDPMPFGKHKGQPLKDVPASYLLWLYEQMRRENDNVKLAFYVEENLNQLNQEAAEEDRDARRYRETGG
jgi:uncharacterized protein (DUF3820 family)